jgi:EAL domain-containing protein (putative c-di-GMP-specific phosphodiesterase class I)
MQKCLRRTDTIARFGGDEFTILLENIEQINEAISIAERIQAELMLPMQIENHTIFTSASIGIVLGATGCDRPAELLRNADIAMYCAKEAGKARYAIFDREMYARTLELLHLESDLRQAIERQEFFLHYQPIVSLVTGKLVGFEALIRWQHPERGLVSPQEFISIAEDIGLIVPIGEWVMHQACQQMREWQLKFPLAANLKISVNLASQQIKEAKLIERIDRVMAETGLDGSFLKLEITESMLLNNTEATINMLSEIRARKIQLSIDDFGKGYSSLSYLHRFPINTLKIDGSFVSQMNYDPENFEIVRTINTLAHNLGLDVTAECVETATEFSQLKALGCEFGQGYFFSKPLDSKAAESLILSDPQW